MLGTLDIYNDMRAVGFDERQATAIAHAMYRCAMKSDTVTEENLADEFRAGGFGEQQAGALASSHYRFMLAIHGCKSPKAV